MCPVTNLRFLLMFCLSCVSRSQTYDLNSVVYVDLMIPENSKLHQTSMFYSGSNLQDMLIVRRSNTFNIRINLNSPFFETNSIQLHFRLPTTDLANTFKLSTESSQGTYNVYTPSSNSQGIQTTISPKGSTVEVQVKMDSNVPVGFYDLFIYNYNANNLSKYSEYSVRDILILFNPWSPEDSVYMKNQDDINEYIFNERGYIVTGNYNLRERRPWIFGQFKSTTLQALKIVLGKLPLSGNARADPVHISRSLSAIVNIQDDQGMMSGKWAPPYDTLRIQGVEYSARSPLTWTGSPEILEEYVRNNGRTIGFAQCWVYACLIATFGRALGIPSRIITNYESGHDYNSNIMIDYTLDNKGDLIRSESESIWNFHVWTEMWMARYDLSTDRWKFGGWQILDGTPQQPSNEEDGTLDSGMEKYQLGPAPLAAVKQSLVNLKYDTRFVYTEVNGDAIYRNRNKQILKYDESRVGKGTFTRGFDGNDVDITLNYKELEGTVNDRISFNKALREIGLSPVMNARSAYTKKPRDFGVQSSHPNYQKIGSVVDFHVTVSNNFAQARYFNISVYVYSVYYNGLKGNDIYRSQYSLYLQASSENRRTVLINQDDYIHKLVPFSIIRIEIVVHTPNRRMFFKFFDLIFEKPQLKITTQGSAVVGVPFYVDVQLKNPLNVPLKNCLFAIQGLRLNGDLHTVEPIAALETKSFRFALVFDQPILETIVIIFMSDELDQVPGEIQVPVKLY